MIIDESRLNRQNLVVDRIIFTNGNAAVAGATGFGKTYCAFLLIERFNSQKIVHIVVPTERLKIQWEQQLAKKGIKNAIVFVINTYIKEKRSCDLLIVDEAHRVSNEESKHFNTVTDICDSPRKVYFSATYTKDQLKFLESKGIKLVDTITLEECIKNGWINNFVQYNLELELNEDEQKKYNNATNLIKVHFPYFDNDLKLVYKLQSNKEARREYCEVNGFDEKEISMRAARLTGAISTRKSIITNAQSKLDIIPELYKKLNGKTILFSQTIKYIQACHKLIGKNNALIYHSKMSDNDKNKTIDIIENGDINWLLTAKALNEGLDIQSLVYGVRASYDSVERSLVQCIGRILRKLEGKKAIFVNFCIKDTMEVGWLKSAQKNMNNIRWIKSIDEIEI